MNYNPLLFIIVSIFVFSCVPQSKLEYLQESVDKNKVYNTESPEEAIIKPNDELLINVSSFDDNSFNFFENQRSGAPLQASNELAINAISFSVLSDGTIQFPIIGKIEVSGLNTDQVTEKIKQELSPYFDQPNVKVKFAYKKITVLGEVRSPGYHTYTKNKISIFEAIGLASDLTVHGNRKEVLLIRTIGNNTIKYEIDLTQDNIVFSDNYYLQPDDIIYIKPRKSAKWSVVSTPITLVFSTITTALLVLNAIQTNNRL